MVDGARAELDRERDRARLGELVAVEPQREAGVRARLEVAARVLGVERAALEEDVRRLARCRAASGSTSVEQEVDVRRQRLASANSGGTACAPSHVGTPPASRDRAELRELGLAVEAVARLRLERRRPGSAASSRDDARALRASPSSPAARVARTVERIPPPAACSSS